MTSQRLHQAIQATLGVLLLLGFLVWLLVRAPTDTSGGNVFSDVETACQAREIAVQAQSFLLRAAASDENSPREGLRGQGSQIVESSRRLNREVSNVQTNWIPVREATKLLAMCEEYVSKATPENRVAGSESQAMLAPTAQESAKVLESMASQIGLESQELRVRVEKAMADSMFAQGTLFSFRSPDLLLGTLGIAVLLSTGSLYHSYRKLSIPPAQLERSELELIGRTDRRAAIRHCHRRVTDLLELAGDFCRADRT